MKLSTITIAASIFLSVIVDQPAYSQRPFGREQSHCSARLTANEFNARITLRSGPGTQYGSRGYGVVGDLVYLLTEVGPPEVDSVVDNQGLTWFRVGFPRSRAIGWIREDFLNRSCEYAD